MGVQAWFGTGPPYIVLAVTLGAIRAAERNNLVENMLIHCESWKIVMKRELLQPRLAGCRTAGWAAAPYLLHISRFFEASFLFRKALSLKKDLNGMIKCNFPRSNTFQCFQLNGRILYSTAAQGGLNITNEPKTSIAIPAININEASDKLRTTTGDVRPSRRRDLPISPLMDETWLAARERFRTPKAPRSKQPSPLQLKLLRNPYAQALATPVRNCAITNTRLPAYFLQDFELIAHPQTQEIHYLPRSLTSKFRAPEDTPSLEGAEADTESNFTLKENDPRDFSKSTEDVDVASLPDHSKRTGPKAYVLSRQNLLEILVSRTSKFYAAWQKAFPSRRMRSSRSFKTDRLVWRIDMDEFVLELLRRRAVEDLRYIATRGNGYLVGCNGFDEVHKKKGVGAVLWLSKHGGSNMENNMKNGPGEFTTLDVKDRKVAVHNLEALLGEEKSAEIRKHMKIFENEVVVIKSRNNTHRLLLRLWTLQGYLAKYEGFEKGLPHFSKEPAILPLRSY